MEKKDPAAEAKKIENMTDNKPSKHLLGDKTFETFN